MSISSFIKRYNPVVAVVLMPILVCIVYFALAVYFRDPDINADDAIKIAKNDFGCEKILWVKTNALVLIKGNGDGSPIKPARSHFTYYVVGEKDGEEVYIIVPSDPTIEKAYITTWGFDYSFKQIVEKFNELGADYVAEVPDDYYSLQFHYINISKGTGLKSNAEYYGMDCDGDEFYERLDVKAVFYYSRNEDGYRHNYMVAQESGELKAYKRTEAIS